MISVPLIWPMQAVIYRSDQDSTWSVDPPGDLDEGFDPLLREPIIYRDPVTTERESARQELAAVRVPCQVETAKTEDLQQIVVGDDPVTDEVLVVSRPDLKWLGLVDLTTGNNLLKPGDRIECLEKYRMPGTVVRTYVKPLYIYRIVAPRSQGFGEDGYDLELIYTAHRRAS